MAIYCPHCQSPVEPGTDPGGEIVCTVCGSNFRVERGSTVGWRPDEGGRTIGRFELLGLVGTGAFGSVFRARDPRLDRTIALKVPRAGQLGGPDDRDRLLREAKSVARLSHPAIVPVHEVGEHDGLPFLVSEFVQGVTLADQLTARRLSFREAARLVATVARALHYAHGQGVVHRDIKPSNVMLDEKGSPRLMDFGLAKRDAAEITVTLEGQVLGTPAYMSPEQARGDSHAVDGRSDVYSLGVVLYQLLTGELPFRGNVRMLLHQVLHDEPRPPRALNDRVPRDLQTVCLEAMAKEPERRYQTADEFAADLERWLNDQPILARPPGRWYRLRKFAARNRALVGGVLATVLALALGVAGTTAAWWQARNEETRAVKALADFKAEQEKTIKAEAEARLAEQRRKAEQTRGHTITARLAARRGDWPPAIKAYQDALAGNPEDEVGLRLELLDCRQALYDYPTFRAELAALAKRDDLGPYRGKVRLMQAVSLFFSSRPDTDPLPMVREALDLGLVGVDAEFAEALLAPTAREATTHLQRAVRLDPLHRSAHEVLGVTLFLQGRMDELREVAAHLRRIAPNSANAAALEMMRLAIDGDLAGAHRLCEEFRPVFGADGIATLRDFATLMRDFTREEFFLGVDVRGQMASLGEFFRLAPRLAVLMGDRPGDDETKWSGFGVLRIGWMREFARDPAMQKLLGGQLLGVIADPAALADAIGRIAQVLDNGAYHFIHGQLLRMLKRPPAEAEQAYRLALDRPTFAHTERAARLALTEVLWQKAQGLAGPPRWEAENEARQHLHRLAVSGAFPTAAYPRLHALAFSMREGAVALAWAEAWQRQAPGDRNALVARFNTEAAMGAFPRAIQTTEEMLRRWPESAEARNWRGVMHYRLSDFRGAVAGMFDVLALDPRNQYAPGNLDAIEQQLRRVRAEAPILLEKLRLREALLAARRGDHTGAVALAVPLPPAPDVTGEERVARACVFALASSAARRDAKLPEAERAGRAEQYAARALKELRAAMGEGYFKDRLRANFLKDERDLDVLRERTDCQEVMKELGMR